MEQTNMTQDEKYMKQAIKQAKKAYALRIMRYCHKNSWQTMNRYSIANGA